MSRLHSGLHYYYSSVTQLPANVRRKLIFKRSTIFLSTVEAIFKSLSLPTRFKTYFRGMKIISADSIKRKPWMIRLESTKVFREISGPTQGDKESESLSGDPTLLLLIMQPIRTQNPQESKLTDQTQQQKKGTDLRQQVLRKYKARLRRKESHLQ